MKLFTRYNSLSVTAALIVFVLVMASLFFAVREVLIRQLDDSLLEEKDEVLQYIAAKKELPETVKVYDQRTVFEEEPEPYQKFKFRTKYKEVATDTDELVRAVYFGAELNGRHYKVTVIRSLNEMQSLLRYISIVAVAAVAVLLLIWFLVNRFLIKKLLRPFYGTLSVMDKYKLSAQAPLRLPATSIHEFRLLNEKITHLTQRITQDYRVLKEFTGNAAHEMQTPLSVIRAQTDLLLQRENLTQEEAAALQVIDDTTHKLSRLNGSLLLLAKLEAKPFNEKTVVPLHEVVEKKLAERQELLHLSAIDVKKNLEPVSLKANEALLDVILSNLLNNAIRFNHHRGRIVTELSPEKLCIANTSDLPPLDNDKIFGRFYRHPASAKDGTGLGLAIAKQAVMMSGFVIDYSYEKGLHVFTVTFNI